ncbi:MAG: hypothetical protein NT142_07940 [Planctomycetota bacterium]|nr:hypothetical protein [Planctomycetota bacterium]
MDRKHGPKMTRMPFALALILPLVAVVTLGSPWLWAQSPGRLGSNYSPTLLPTWPLVSLMPAKVRVVLHYSIDAERFTRIFAYRELMAQLKLADFERDYEEDPDPSEPENAKHILLTGLLPSKSIHRVASLTAVRSVLATPEGFDLSKTPDALVRVEMMLGRGSQRILLETSGATHKDLDKLGFKEAGVYDTYLGTRLLGMIPTVNLMKIGLALGQPLSKEGNRPPYQPVLVVWADPQSQVVAALPGPVVLPAGMEKVSPELRTVLTEDTKVVRVEVLFDEPFADQASAILRLAEIAPKVTFEALLGPAVTMVGPVPEIRKMANLAEVNAIRPGPNATSGSVSVMKDFQPVRKELIRPETAGIRVGKPSRETIAIIDDDFRGWQGLAQAGTGEKKGVRFIDLTAERNLQITPDPFFGAANEKGHGTLLAQNLLVSHPESKLILVRIDPSVPAMVHRVAKAISGDDALTDEVMAQRMAEIRKDRQDLQDLRAAVEKRWKDDNGDDFAEDSKSVQLRMEYRKSLKDTEILEKAHHARLERLLAHQAILLELARVRLVLCPLVWNEGLPRSGASTLSRWMDDRPFRGALWLQSAGDRPGQSWNGTFRDHDGNGVMEWSMLAVGKDPFPAENMALLFQTQGGAKAQDEIPAGTLVRVTVQWREPRDPYFTKTDRKASRLPIADLKPKLVRVEPTKGNLRLADRAIVGQASGPPLLIDHTLNSAVFESHIFFEAPSAGRYELRLEGQIPDTIIPAGAPQLPVNRQKPEIHPVIWLKTFSPGGVVVFSQPGERPMVGVPGDAQSVLTVGQSQPKVGESALGQLANPKPEFHGISTKGITSSVDSMVEVAQWIWSRHHPDQDVRYWQGKARDYLQGTGSQNR